MPTRMFDASQITKRRSEKAVAGSFLNRLNPPNSLPGSAPYLGITSNSIINAVKSGSMTEYTRYPTCVGISPGCPCPELNTSLTSTSNVPPAIPGPVSEITFTVGSIVVSWNAPIIGGTPKKYQVTPYLNGISQTPVITSNTSYRFTGLQEWQPYTFTVCAMNSGGSGPIIPSHTYFIAPPETLSSIMSGNSTAVISEPSLKYIINSGLDVMLEYIASANLGPTRGSRFIYLWITSVVSAWNWVRPESRISGTHDNWNWDKKCAIPLNSNDSIIWICSIIDYITPFFVVSGYKSIYNCPTNVIQRVKVSGEWETWVNSWQAWYNVRQNDGFTEASGAQPTSSANWAKTIIVDGSTVTDISEFPEAQQWTSLTVLGTRKNYLTYLWDLVESTCLSESDEVTIQNSVQPATGLERDAEIDNVKSYTANLTDQQKVIAEFWAGGPGTVSPPLMFIWLWKEYIRVLPDISCPDMMFSLQDLAIHLFEGGRITWRLKAAHMEARPIQEIRRRYAGQQIQSWNGMVDGSQWVPYQEANFVTPPFADFPSGHSHFSKAFALTMTKWFGVNILKGATYYDKQALICPLFSENETGVYGDFVVKKGTSDIEPRVVPSSAVTLQFGIWDDMATQAGLSRLYGGIHALTAHTSSQQVAIKVDEYINASWNIRTQ